MSRVKLCVIVPVYNMERYVETCIDSLLAQTYESLQIVLVNDRSTDSSLSILKKYQKRFPDKIIVIDSKENMRQGGARNLGIRATKSDYIGFVDADDFVHPMMYESLMKETDEGNIDIVYCRYMDVNENASFDNLPENIKNVKEIRVENLYKALSDEEKMQIMTSHEYGNVCGGIYRRSLIEENSLYFPEHLAYEDNFWVYAIHLNMQNVAIIFQPLYFYRKQGESTTHKKNALHHYDRIEIGNRLLAYATEKNLLQRYYKILEYLFIEVFTMNSYTIFLKTFNHPDEHKIKQVKMFLKDKFPKWRKNRFYNQKFSFKKKIKINLMMILPVKAYMCMIG